MFGHGGSNWPNSIQFDWSLPLNTNFSCASFAYAKKLKPLFFLEKPYLKTDNSHKQYYKYRESQFAVRTWNTADIYAKKAGQKTQRQKNGGNNGEDVHFVVHLF